MSTMYQCFSRDTKTVHLVRSEEILMNKTLIIPDTAVRHLASLFNKCLGTPSSIRLEADPMVQNTLLTVQAAFEGLEVVSTRTEEKETVPATWVDRFKVEFLGSYLPKPLYKICIKHFPIKYTKITTHIVNKHFVRLSKKELENLDTTVLVRLIAASETTKKEHTHE